MKKIKLWFKSFTAPNKEFIDNVKQLKGNSFDAGYLAAIQVYSKYGYFDMLAIQEARDIIVNIGFEN